MPWKRYCGSWIVRVLDPRGYGVVGVNLIVGASERVLGVSGPDSASFRYPTLSRSTAWMRRWMLPFVNTVYGPVVRLQWSIRRDRVADSVQPDNRKVAIANSGQRRRYASSGTNYRT